MRHQPTNGLLIVVLKLAEILKTTKQGLQLVEQSFESPQDSIVNKATTSLVGEEESYTSARLKTPKQPGTEIASQLLLLLMLAESGGAEVPCLRTCLSAN